MSDAEDLEVIFFTPGVPTFLQSAVLSGRVEASRAADAIRELMDPYSGRVVRPEVLRKLVMRALPSHEGNRRKHYRHRLSAVGRAYAELQAEFAVRPLEGDDVTAYLRDHMQALQALLEVVTKECGDTWEHFRRLEKRGEI